MAYGLRYKSDWYNYFGKLVSVKIYKQDYADSVEDDVRVSEVTITANYQNDNTPIIGTGAKIVIIADTSDMSYLEDMLLSYERQFLGTIEYDGTVVFRGFTLCDLNERQLLPFAAVTIQFTDYLHRLEDKYPDCLKEKGGMSSAFTLAGEMIGLTNLDLPLHVNSTLFEDSMDIAATDTFLPQVFIQNAQFYTNSYEYENIYDVINKTLHPFSAFMYYYQDKWIIERQEDITRNGDWVRYDDVDTSSGAEEAAVTTSLKQEIYKQGSAGENFEYVDMSQIIEYDSGLHTLILKLNDKIKDTLVYNDYSTDMLTTADATPDAGSLDESVWYRHDDVSNLSVGTKLHGMEQFVRWTAAVDMDQQKGLYYNFEIQFNSESNETTELNISYKASADVDLTDIYNIYLHFYLRLDGGAKTDYYLYKEATNNYIELSATATRNETIIDTSSIANKSLNWEVNFNFPLTEIFATRVGLTSIWEQLGYPERQKFTLMILPAISVEPVLDQNLVSVNYFGDIIVTVNEAEVDNKIEYHINENFVKTDEIDLYLFDLDNVNYSNGLLGSDRDTLTNLWTSENSTVACPLYEVFAKCKFRKYGRTIHRLKGTILIDAALKPFTILTDNNILNDSGGVISFLINGFTWNLDRGTYEIEAEEYTEEEIIVAGVTYDSSGNTEEPAVPATPTGLALVKAARLRRVEASWNPVSGSVIGYKLQRKPYYRLLTSSWVDAYRLIYTGTATSYIDNVQAEGPPTSGMLLTYRVCAYNSVGDSAYSAEVTINWYD